MNYLYAHILVTTLLLLLGFIINNTGNCNVYLSHCLDINNFIYNEENDEENNEQTINCINETSNELITIILFVFIIIISLLNIFFIIESYNPTPTYILGLIIYATLFVVNILSLIRCIKPVKCERCEPIIKNKNINTNNIILSILIILWLYVIILTLYYDDDKFNSNYNFI